MIRVVIFDLLVALTHLRSRGELCVECAGRGHFVSGGASGVPRMRILCGGCDGVGRIGGGFLDEQCATAAAIRFARIDVERLTAR